MSGCLDVKDAPKTQIDPVMERYEELSAEFTDLVQEENPDTSFARFEKVLGEEPEMTSVCHGLAHEIGHAAYLKYGFEDAFDYENDFCGAGYIHGIVETHLELIRDIEPALPTICPAGSRKCFHGIGHGIMYKKRNDLTESVRLCETFTQQFQRIQCAEGVFMENFETDTRFHTSEFLNPEDPFAPCRGQTKINEGVCALYVPRYHLELNDRKYEDTIAWCMTNVPAGPRDACIKGVGDAAMKYNVDRPLVAEEICENVPLEKRHYCMQGIVSYYIVHFASASKGAELCPLLKEENRATCERIVSESRAAYPE
jgi:hypothetical protein